VVPIQQPLEGLAQVLDAVEAVGDLDGGGRALPCAVGIRPASIPCDDLDARMGREPGGEGRRRPVGQEIDRPMPLQVDEDGAKHLPASIAPIVHAQHARRRRGHEVRPADRIDEGVVADDRADGGEEAGGGSPAEGEGERREQRAQPRGAPPVRRDKYGETLGEDTPRTARRGAAPAPGVQADPHRQPLPGEIAEPSLVPTVHARGDRAAIGATDGRTAWPHHHGDTRLVGA